MSRIKASVIIVVHAGAHRLDDSLSSLVNLAGRGDIEIIVVDNGSEDRCGDLAPRLLPGARSVRSEDNLGFVGGVHLGADAAEGELLLLLNDDAAANECWADAHIEALEHHPRAAASAGRLTTWDGSRHDFVRPVMTFDGHAFQLGQGAPIPEHDPPRTGEPLPFACGGNMAIRRNDWDRLGGFAPDLFAYFEDVDLGWRSWAQGRQVVAAPEAMARHRGAATSSLLGDLRRGVLFERNALRTFFANADTEHRSAIGPAVLATFMHRLSTYSQASPALADQVADPFGVTAPPSMAQRWRQRLSQQGLVATLRHLVVRIVEGPRAGLPRLESSHLLMQLQALQGFFAGIDGTEARRAALERSRVMSDREIIARFPRLIVPTYPGDAEWMSSPAFCSMLPSEWAFEQRRLDEILHPSLLS